MLAFSAFCFHSTVKCDSKDMNNFNYFTAKYIQRIPSYKSFFAYILKYFNPIYTKNVIFLLAEVVKRSLFRICNIKDYTHIRYIIFHNWFLFQAISSIIQPTNYYQ